MSEENQIVPEEKNKGVWVGSKYLPIPKVLDTEKDREKFIKILGEHGGKIRPAAKQMGISYGSVYRRKQESPEFNRAILLVREIHDEEFLDELEAISEEMAKDKDTKSFPERKFHLQALNRGKYNFSRSISDDGRTVILISTTSPTIESRVDPYKVVPEEELEMQEEVESE